jgi:hypothetical protein
LTEGRPIRPRLCRHRSIEADAYMHTSHRTPAASLRVATLVHGGTGPRR